MSNFFTRDFIIGFAWSFLIQLVGIHIFSLLVLDKSFLKAVPYLTSQGIFTQSVAVVGLTGYLIFKWYDVRGKLKKAQGALGALIVWFLFLLGLYFGK